MQLKAQAERRTDAHLAADLEDALEFGKFLEGDDHVFVEPPSPQGQTDKVLVLKAVTAQQRLGVDILN